MTNRVIISEEEKAGLKHDHGKLEWSLLPIGAMEEVIRGLMAGAEKYGEYNWLKVEPSRKRYWNAAMRHITNYRKGNIYDDGEDGTGCHNLALAIDNLLFILHNDIGANDDNLMFLEG